MKTVVSEADRDAVLQQWMGSAAIVWLFNVSLGRMAIRLERSPHEAEVLYIVAVRTQYMCGPFRWKDSQIRVQSQTGEGDTVYLITDEEAGFKLRCDGGVVLLRGPVSDLDTSFDNFLGETDSAEPE